MRISGAQLQALRKKKKMIQQQLADAVGVSKTTIVDWEKGRYFPEGENLTNLAGVLEVSSLYLMGETDDPTPARGQRQHLNIGINLDDPEVLSKVLSGLREKNIHLPQAEGDDDTPFPGEKEPIMPPQILLPVIDQDACAGPGFDYADVEAYAIEWIPYPLDALGGPIGPHKPYFVKVNGDSMIGVGIEDGCMVAINRDWMMRTNPKRPCDIGRPRSSAGAGRWGIMGGGGGAVCTR